MKAIIDGTPESIAEEKELISLSHIFIQLKKAMPKPPKPVYEITDRVGSSGTCFVFHLRDFLPKGRAPTLDELATIGRFVICVHLGFCEIVGFTGMELANKQKLDGDNRDVRRFRDWINWMASQWLESTGSDKDTANEKVMAGMDMDADSDSLLRYKWLTSGRHSEI